MIILCEMRSLAFASALIFVGGLMLPTAVNADWTYCKFSGAGHGQCLSKCKAGANIRIHFPTLEACQAHKSGRPAPSSAGSAKTIDPQVTDKAAKAKATKVAAQKKAKAEAQAAAKAKGDATALKKAKAATQAATAAKTKADTAALERKQSAKSAAALAQKQADETAGAELLAARDAAASAMSHANGVLAAVPPGELRSSLEAAVESVAKALNEKSLAALRTETEVLSLLARRVDELQKASLVALSEPEPDVAIPAESSLVAPPPAQKRVALVMGNSAYRHVAKLANPANDAAGMAAALTRLGFEVIEGRDLDKTATEKTIRAFQKSLSGADVALFFYAGHGLQVAGQNYIAPIDATLKAEGDLDFETVPVDLVLKQMERGTKTNLVFLDACRDNPLADNLARSMGTRSASVGRGLARVGAGLGTLIAFATQPGSVALDGAGANSPFTAALLKHIERPGIDVGELMIEVRREVLAATNGVQVPWDQSSLTGRFYFSGTPQLGSAESEVTADYQLADRIGTKEAWEAFLTKHGRSQGNFYVELAEAALRKLTTGQ
jgi:uncharacterized caspase-like protein